MTRRSRFIRRGGLKCRFWPNHLFTIAAALCLFSFSTLFAAPQTITPAAYWYDSDGNLISAHGGGIIKVGSIYYFFGEYMDSDPNNLMNAGMGHVTHQFVTVPCYASTDFVNWTFLNNVLTQQPSGDLGPGRVVERPKVIYNDSTAAYVMYLHIDSATYTDARVGVASCPAVDGDYTYHGSFRPDGRESRDMTIFKDTDANAYLITHDGLEIYRLSADYLSVDTWVAQAGTGSHEAPAMFKIGSTYYLLASQKTWWQSNDNHYFTAPAITGPWTYRGDFTPNSSNTWNSQTTYVQPIDGAAATTYVFMADRWCEGCFADSVYIWLPLKINGTTVSLDWYDSWTLDSDTGAWSPLTPPGTLLLYDGFESVTWDANFNDTPHNWQKTTSTRWRDFASAWADPTHNGNFTSDSLDTSDALAVHVDFWFRKDDTDANGISGGPDFLLYYYNGSAYKYIADLDTLGPDDQWLNYTHTITNPSYFISNFRIRFAGTCEQNENVWLDEVVVTKEIQPSGCDAANLDGTDPVNFKDFALLAPDWRLNGEGLTGDITNDSSVDFNDLAQISLFWLTDCSLP